MDSFVEIPFFIAVVESGSFSAAAKKLSLSTPAVSKRISQLENRLGVRLLQRTTRRLSLTEAGVKYYDYVRAAARLIQEAEDIAGQLQELPQGILRLSVPMVFGRLHITPLIPAFLRAHPQVSINMTMDDGLVDLVGGGFDLGIRIGKLEDSSMIGRPLSPCASVLCASPDYLQRYGTPQCPADLSQHNCLFYSYFQAGVEWTFHGPQGEERVLPQGNFQVNNSEALYSALLEGLGICQMPKFIAGPALAEGRLVSLLDDYHLPLHHIYAIYPERRHIPAKMRVFLDYLNQHLGEGSAYRRHYEDA